MVIPQILKDGLRYRLLKQRLGGLSGDTRVRYEIEDKIARTRYDGEWSLNEAEELFESLEPGRGGTSRVLEEEPAAVDIVAVAAGQSAQPAGLARRTH